MRKNICAVSVIFDPSPAVFERINIIKNQVDFMFVVDNSTKPVSMELTGCFMHHNANKGGLAGALNYALKKARHYKIRYMFLFDQDTDVCPDFVEKMLIFSSDVENSLVGIYGPRHVNTSTKQPVRVSAIDKFFCSQWPTEQNKIIKCYFMINSCSMLDLKIIPQEFYYEENLCVDMVDVEFGLRLNKNGIKTLCFPCVTVSHGIGNRSPGSFIFSATNYDANRKYFQTKNRFILWRKYYKDFPFFVFSDMQIWLFDCFRTLIFENNKLKKFKSISEGIRDGFSSYVQFRD